VTNTDSIAAMRALSQRLGRKVGPSTGTNFFAVAMIANEMLARGENGSILSLLCDAGERYLPTYYDNAWVKQAFGDSEQVYAAFRRELAADREPKSDRAD
jgi:cysteine synthase